MASRITRKQATRFALVAFVAADCAGVAYVQHRMNQNADEAEQLAYAAPVAVPVAAPERMTFSPAAPSLAMAAPVVGVPVAGPAAQPAAAKPASAPAPVLALAAAPAPKAAANPLRAPRMAPVAGLGRAELALTVPAIKAAPAHRHAASRAADLAAAGGAAADGVFANAFSLDGEAPDTEHRFGQDAEPSGSASLADLVAPREEPAPIFDKAGIAPVTGQAATVDGPASVEIPSDPAATDAPATKG